MAKRRFMMTLKLVTFNSAAILFPCSAYNFISSFAMRADFAASTIQSNDDRESDRNFRERSRKVALLIRRKRPDANASVAHLASLSIFRPFLAFRARHQGRAFKIVSIFHRRYVSSVRFLPASPASAFETLMGAYEYFIPRKMPLRKYIEYVTAARYGAVARGGAKGYLMTRGDIKMA